MRGFSLGKIAGFQISIDWSWLIIFVLVTWSLAATYFPRTAPHLGAAAYWAMGVIAAILFFAAVVAHELMHSVVAKRYGIDIKGITLFIFGGMSQTAEEPQTPGVEFAMAIVGPAASLAISGVFYAVTYAATAAHWPAAVVAVVSYIAWINLVLGAFNLVPGFPLDGGRVLRSILWSSTKNLEAATRYASYVGQGFGYLLMAFGFYALVQGAAVGRLPISGIWLGFIGWFLAGMARTGYEQVLLRQALSGVAVERVMTVDVPTVAPDVTVDDFVRDYLMRHEYACYPVLEDDSVKGIVSIDEVRSVPQDQWARTTVAEISQPVEDSLRISKDADAWDALLKLATDDTRRLLVMHDSSLDGTVSQENILRLVRTKMRLGI